MDIGGRHRFDLDETPSEGDVAWFTVLRFVPASVTGFPPGAFGSVRGSALVGISDRKDRLPGFEPEFQARQA